MLLDNVRMKNSTAIAQTLRHLMDRYDEGKGISENALSRATYDMFGEEDGVPQPTIHRILSGSSKDPKSRTILRLAEFFGVTDSQLRGYAPLPDQFAVGEGEGDYSASDLPVLTWEQADNAELVLEKIKQGMIKVQFEAARCRGPHVFALIVQGDAMRCSGRYSFPEGTRIVVDTSIDVRHSEFVVATATGYSTPIFRRLESEGGVRRLVPLNKRPGYEIITMSSDDRIIGKVTEYYSRLP